MKLLRRNRPETGPQVRSWREPERSPSHADEDEARMADEDPSRVQGSQSAGSTPPEADGPQPQPERAERKLADPGLRDLSRRDYFAIVKRAGKEALADNI